MSQGRFCSHAPAAGLTVTQDAGAARAVIAQRYGRAPRRTVAAGISNGGYLVRWQLENQSNRAAGQRYYRIDGGNPLRDLSNTFPDRLRPILPCLRAAFTALDTWAAGGQAPSKSVTLPQPATGDLANNCSLST